METIFFKKVNVHRFTEDRGWTFMQLNKFGYTTTVFTRTLSV